MTFRQLCYKCESITRQKDMLVFLFTDIEGSTEKWEKHRTEMEKALSRHDAILQEHIRKYGGRIIKHMGDGVFAVFDNGEPLQCAVEIQKDLAKEDWGVLGALRIRMALHAGNAEKKGEDYFGPVVNRTARILATSWGGQILLSDEAVKISRLPPKATLQDFGVHLLKDLGEPQQIYGLVHSELELQKFPALRSLSAHPHNLPPQTTPLIGREEELAKIASLLENPSYRLLTLVGPGGIGKTRLALQTAADKIEGFSHGVYFIPLAPLSSAESLVSAMADSLRFPFYSQEDPKIQLINYLREKEILLVTDNFEHLLAGVGLISEILEKAPQVKILATSRERLNLKEEQIIEIPGLSFPADKTTDQIEEYGAVRLFLQSARRFSPSFTLQEADKPFIIRICRLVTGIPLAIELAAAWVKVLTSKEIAQEIEKNIDFLNTSLRDLPERHRNLRGVFEYSWKLLSEKEQEVFRKMSVFRGGFSREAAEKVTGVSLPLLSALIDKSLLRRTPSGRFEMHEVLRQYADEKLGEIPQEKEKVRNLHCAYYAEFLSQREENLKGDRQKQALEEISREIENVRTGWQWAIGQKKTGEIDKFIGSLFLFYDIRSLFREGLEVFGNALQELQETNDLVNQSEEVKSVIIGKLLVRQGNFYFRFSDYDKAKNLAQKSLSIFSRIGLRKEIASSLSILGNIAFQQGYYPQAKQLYQENLAIIKELGDRRGIALSFSALGNIAHILGEYQKAKQLFQESLSFYKEIGNRKGIANSLNNLGHIAYNSGEYQEAKRLYQESLAIHKELGNRGAIENTLMYLGNVAYSQCEYPEAKQLYQESLVICKEISDRDGIARSINSLAFIAHAYGEYQEAKQLYQESLTIYKEIGARFDIANLLIHLGTVAHALEGYQSSKKYFYEGLKTLMNLRRLLNVLIALFKIAEVFSKENQKERALEVLVFILNHPDGGQHSKNQLKQLITEIESKLSPQVIASVREKAKLKKIEELVTKILEELSQ